MYSRNVGVKNEWCVYIKINIKFVKEKIDEKGWTKAESARRTGLSRSYVGRVLNMERNGGGTFIIGLSTAFPDEKINDFYYRRSQSRRRSKMKKILKIPIKANLYQHKTERLQI
ncbi:MAG: helix-turn-helix transcriptional regulator [Ruminococcus flavefaciens]|nr:helix-turn-helix transcriptional regulator [Ruminococcus flavefaciens]